MTIDAVAGAGFVLDMSVRALATAAAVALLLRLLRMREAAVLHSAWSAVLFAMLLMPVLPSIVPALPIPLPVSAGALLGPRMRAAARGTDESSLAQVRSSTKEVDAINTVSSPQASDESPRPGPESSPMTFVSGSWVLLTFAGVYVTGVLLFVARLVYGWSLAFAMVRRARRGGPVPVHVPVQAYESSEVIVPMTVGAIRPVIVVPVAWRTWDSDMLAAIVAHEAAHVRRHDPLINLAAHLNLAIFWFNPLGWWLERKLAITAEHACDDAAACAIKAPDRYAEILVAMADIVRQNRGRFAWQGIGVNGAGLLDSRINRLLRGEAFASASRGKKIAAAIGCFVAIATVAACRQHASATALREDPELAKRLANQDEQRKKFEAARDMTQEQADALEQRVAVNPEDFDARGQVVTYYRTSATVPWDKKVPGLRRHALWLIEHHPEHEVRPPALSPKFDPEGFAAAKKLWETHLAKPDASPFLIYRAASFFAPHDKPYAEQLILRGMALDPDSSALRARMPPDVAGYEWPQQLASLYAAALLGSESVWGTYNDLRTHVDRVNSSYAMLVQQKLDASTDAKLLARVGGFLTSRSRPVKDPAVNQALEQARALGVGYLERALALDPQLERAKVALVRVRLRGQSTAADRLANRAHEQFMVAEDITEYSKKDMVAGKQQRDEARARAEEVLKMAAAHPQDPAYSAAVMTAHHVLATAALRDGDRQRAVHHLRESVKVPASEQIQYAPSFSWSRPVNRLLREGERETVAEFLEALARLTITERDRLLKDAQAIRAGRMPASYQDMVAREGQ